METPSRSETSPDHGPDRRISGVRTTQGDLRVVHSAGDGRVEIGFELERLGSGECPSLDARRPLGVGEGEQRCGPGLGRGDHDAALALVLDRREGRPEFRGQFGGDLRPARGRAPRQVQFGARALVRDEQVAFAGGAGAARTGAAVDHGHAQTRCREGPRAGGADDSGSDHQHFWHAILLSLICNILQVESKSKS